MTTEEKLKHFKAAALEEARQESTAAIEEHRRALEKLFQEHTVDKDRQAALEVKTETDRPEIYNAWSYFFNALQ